jgi:predicted KAP-like P-loop ATPase
VVRAYSRYRAALNTPDAPISKEQKQAINAALERLKKQIPEEQLKMLDS